MVKLPKLSLALASCLFLLLSAEKCADYPDYQPRMPHKDIKLFIHVVNDPNVIPQTYRHEDKNSITCGITFGVDIMTPSVDSLAKFEWEIWGNCLGNGGDNPEIDRSLEKVEPKGVP